MEIGARREFLTNCNIAWPGADQLHADEEADKCTRELGAVKNKSTTARSRTDCLQPSLHIGYTSPKLHLQSTHIHTHIKTPSTTRGWKPVCQQVIVLQPQHVPGTQPSCSCLASTSQELCPGTPHRRRAWNSTTVLTFAATTLKPLKSQFSLILLSYCWALVEVHHICAKPQILHLL